MCKIVCAEGFHFNYITGLYLYSANGNMPQGEVPAIKKHLQSQMKLNFIFLFYSATTWMAINYHSYSIASVVCVLGDIAYREYSIYRLGQVLAGYSNLVEHLPVERRPENQVNDDDIVYEAEGEYDDEDDDRFLSITRQETSYDPLKEDFCAGRQPLLCS